MNLILVWLLLTLPVTAPEPAASGAHVGMSDTFGQDVDEYPTSATIRGLSSWYCGGGSPCTRNHSPSELIAAIDPTTGIEQGEWITVWHGDASVVVEIVDVCACPGARIVDLSRLAFSRLADPSVGLIRVTLVPERTSQDAAPRLTTPPTDTP